MSTCTCPLLGLVVIQAIFIAFLLSSLAQLSLADVGQLAAEVDSLRDQSIAKDIIILELEKKLIRYGRLEETVNSLLVNEHDPDATLHE